MADPAHNPPGDDVLTAYIDGELDADARRAVDAALAADAQTFARLNALKGAARPFKESFQLVTDAAPRERLTAMLAAVAPPRADHAPRRVWMSAAAVVLFAAGIAIGTNSNIVQRQPVASGPFQVAVSNTDAAKLAAPPVAKPLAADTDTLQRQAGRGAEQAPAVVGELAAPKAAAIPAPATTAAQPPPRPQALADAAPPAPARSAPSGAGSAVSNFAAPSAAPGAPAAGTIAVAPATPSPAPLALGGLAATAPAPSAPAATAPQAGNGPVPGTWRQVVTDYIQLTTADNLSLMPENPSLPAAVVAYSGKLQLDLSGKLTVPMTSLKDVRLHDYRGRPLVEVSFLSDDRMTVVTFCVILNMSMDAPIGFETRNGQNVVFWSQGGHGFMVAGKQPREALEAIARDLAARFI